MITLKHKGTGNVWQIDEAATESDMRRTETHFFKKAHGKRETYDEYRGFLIVRSTVTFTGAKPQRMTAIYFYGKGEGMTKPALMNVHPKYMPNSVKAAQRMIDKLIELGEYEYDIEL
jgi:hypothetical protein